MRAYPLVVIMTIYWPRAYSNEDLILLKYLGDEGLVELDRGDRYTFNFV